MRYATDPPLPRSVALALERFTQALAEDLPGVDFVLALASPSPRPLALLSPSRRPFTTTRLVTAIASVAPDEGLRIVTGLLDRLHHDRDPKCGG